MTALREIPDSPVVDHPERSAARRTSGVRRTARVLVGAYLVIVATLVSVGLVLTHVGLLAGAVRWDNHVSEWFVRRRTAGLNQVSGWFTFLANTLSIVVPAAVVTSVLALRRWGRRALLLVLGLGLELASFLTANYTVRRPRPTVPHLGSTPTTFSWPSGHVAATLVLYGGIAFLVMLATSRVWIRLGAWAAATALTTGVALSRVYRGEHHLLDVLAGIALGAAALFAAVRATSDEEVAEVGR